MKILVSVLIIILGFVFHDLYKSTGIELLALICPVNESKWEHWKIAFWPMVIIGMLEYPFIRERGANYIYSLAIGIVVFEAVTFGLIELYEAAFGASGMAVHISTYVLGAAAGQAVRYLLMKRVAYNKVYFWVGVIILLVHAAAFVVFTYRPPAADYFMDSTNGTYGIRGTTGGD